jgi:uncharacterized protein
MRGAALLFAFCASLGAVSVERNAAVKMRDGTVLRADVYRPSQEGRFPVIVQRTPYDKTVLLPFGMKAAESGYVAVAQDCRGRYASAGDWYPLAHEFEDGYDTVEWAAALPYSNGKVGLFGGSYGGFTTLMGALAHPPHLAGFVSIEAGDSYYEGFIYRGGVFQKWLAESWVANSLAPDSLARAARQTIDVAKWSQQLPAEKFPVLELPSARTFAGYFFDWLRHPAYDDYWKRCSFDDRYASVEAPGVHVGGWYDAFTPGPPRAFASMRARAATAEARNGQRLIMGPWSHGPLRSKAGDLDFGPSAAIDPGSLGFEWFDYLLRGARNGLERRKPVRIFVMGENVWRDEEEWPLPRAKATPYYLHSGRLLNTALPEEEPGDEYIHDPANPVPTTGGGICCGSLQAGALDQRTVEARSDVLVYSTEPFDRDIEITGPIQLDVYVDAPTDIVATLVDVWPNGYAQNVTDGVRRGDSERIHLDLAPTSNLFRAGHRLRVHIAGSSFPRYDLNSRKGTIRIYHDKTRPSALTVPVVPRKS